MREYFLENARRNLASDAVLSEPTRSNVPASSGSGIRAVNASDGLDKNQRRVRISADSGLVVRWKCIIIS